jgi:glutathione S-transferase
MSKPIHIIGNYGSPYVRKVLVTLELKGIAYQLDPIVPFYGDDSFSRISPLRRIPVLIEGELTLCDSSVICQYLEDRTPEPAIFPRDIADRARARWIEEYADTRIGDLLIWRLFNQVVLRRVIFGERPDKELVQRNLETDVPEMLDWLEPQAPASGFMFGESLSIADISLAAFFRTASFARFAIDPARWPKTAAYVERVLASPPFAKLRPFEEAIMRTPIAQQRAALAELGAPLIPESVGAETPRRGVMSID